VQAAGIFFLGRLLKGARLAGKADNIDNAANAADDAVDVLKPQGGAYSNMTDDEYRELGRFIWQTYVPKRGQAGTVQGELLRANEKLRDESQRNGNINWDEGHEILAHYLLETLTAATVLAEEAKAQLRLDIQRILDFENPYTKDDLFDRIERSLLDWCAAHPEPVPRDHDPNLHR